MCGGCGNWDEATRRRVSAAREPGDVLVSTTPEYAAELVRDGLVQDGRTLRCVEVADGLVRCS